MIVKVKNCSTWILFDGAGEVSYHKLHRDGAGEAAIGVRADVVDLTNNPVDEDTAKAGITEIWMYKDHQVIRQILAYSPIYILNDEGKTIERI